MNAKQESKLNMYNAVKQHCNDNLAIINAVAAFLTAFNALTAKIASIVSTEQLSNVPLTGIAKDKTTAKQNLCQIAADVASIISAFASATANATLKAQVNFSLSKLLQTRDDQLAPRCQNFYDIGTANMGALKDYGLTTAQLDALAEAIATHSAATPKPRTAVSQRKTYNANLTALFNAADDILKEQMDKNVVVFKAEHPDFVKEYFSNRVIIDPATTATRISGTVVNKADSKPIKGATVTAVEAGKASVTTVTGKYTLKPLTPGNYTITATAVGFKDFLQSPVEAKLGAIQKFDIGLESV